MCRTGFVQSLDISVFFRWLRLNGSQYQFWFTGLLTVSYCNFGIKREVNKQRRIQFQAGPTLEPRANLKRKCLWNEREMVSCKQQAWEQEGEGGGEKNPQTEISKKGIIMMISLAADVLLSHTVHFLSLLFLYHPPKYPPFYPVLRSSISVAGPSGKAWPPHCSSLEPSISVGLSTAPPPLLLQAPAVAFIWGLFGERALLTSHSVQTKWRLIYWN